MNRIDKFFHAYKQIYCLNPLRMYEDHIYKFNELYRQADNLYLNRNEFLTYFLLGCVNPRIVNTDSINCVMRSSLQGWKIVNIHK